MSAAQQLNEDLLNFAAECYYDPLQWVFGVYPWGKPGTFLADEPGPDIWQMEALRAIGQELLLVDTDRGLTNAAQIAIGSGHGTGKQLADFEAIFRADGTLTNIGSLKVGDSIIGGDGTPCKVIGVYPQGVNRLFRVTFSDGSSVLAGAEHLWTVSSASDRECKRRPRVLSTEELSGKLHQRFQIPMCGPIEWPERQVLLHPYVIGCLIGDGAFKASSKTVTFSKREPDMADRLNALLPAGYSLRFSHGSYSISKAGDHGGGRNVVFAEIERYGLSGKGAADKFIPDDYLYTSVAARTQLLRGLMDTDGCCGTRKGRRGMRSLFSTSSSRLRDQMIWLVRSLGGTCTYTADNRIGRTKLFPRNSGRTNLVNYQMSVCLPATINPFWCARKRSLFDQWVASGAKREPIRAIESIEYERDAPATCIRVDNADALFVTTDFIVTHNTAFESWLIQWWLSTRRSPAMNCTAGTDSQLKTKLWRELAKWHAVSANREWFDWQATSFRMREHPLTVANAIPWSENNAHAFAGLHEADPAAIFEEASVIADPIWSTQEGAFTTPGGLWVAVGNLTNATGAFYDCFKRNKKYWRTFNIDSRSARKADKTRIAQWLEQYGETSDFFRIRVMGLPPAGGGARLFNPDLIDAAVAKEIQEEWLHDETPTVMGIDVGGGSNRTVCVVRKGPLVRPDWIIRFSEGNMQRVASLIAEQISKWRPDYAFIDAHGIGKGVFDHLERIGYHQVIAAYAGDRSAVVNKLNFYNPRAEWWSRMADWLRVSKIPPDRDLRDELLAQPMNHDTANRLHLMSKADMREAGLESPDTADALSLTFSEIVHSKRGHTSIALEGGLPAFT